MRLLLDTHVALALLQGTLAERYPEIAHHLNDSKTSGFFSVASLWEIAIKSRLGKLDPGMELDQIGEFLHATGLQILSIEAAHVTTAVHPEPKTRDPFDKLLLAQCKVEDLKLVTLDRAIVGHSLAAKV